MCEALIRVANKSTKDTDPRHAHRSQRGDVIVVMPDGHVWTRIELTNPEWRVVRFPGLPPEALGDLVQPVYDRGGKLIQRRARGIDLDSIKALSESLVNGKVNVLPPGQLPNFLAARKNKASSLTVIG